MLEESFCPQLLIYAVEYDHWITCCESIATEGLYITVTGKDGQATVAPNPAVKQRKDAEATLVRIGSNFGFSPVDRQRMKAEAADPQKTSLQSLIAQIAADDPEEQ